MSILSQFSIFEAIIGYFFSCDLNIFIYVLVLLSVKFCFKYEKTPVWAITFLKYFELTQEIILFHPFLSKNIYEFVLFR